MPQLNSGGKFVFGLSELHSDLSVVIPPQAFKEYHVEEDESLIIFTGSKSSGGFCVTSERMLGQSKLSKILAENPCLRNPKSEWMVYKGRKYRAVKRNGNRVPLTEEDRRTLGIATGDVLMCVRSSDIAFTFMHHGPLMERSKNYQGEIPRY
ncbi:MAG: hypothetical protein IJ710_00155 [Prevotella sp.]|nr:hypothetical protein [Prevotella sp.]